MPTSPHFLLLPLNVSVVEDVYSDDVELLLPPPRTQGEESIYPPVYLCGREGRMCSDQEMVQDSAGKALATAGTCKKRKIG